MMNYPVIRNRRIPIRKVCIILLLILCNATAFAGRGGYFQCRNCSYRSDEIYLGGGQMSSGHIFFCEECGEYRSFTVNDILTDPGDFQDPETPICQVCGTIGRVVERNEIQSVTIIGDEFPINLGICPQCGTQNLYFSTEFLWD